MNRMDHEEVMMVNDAVIPRQALIVRRHPDQFVEAIRPHPSYVRVTELE